jgi:hypothetical protein
VVDWSAAGSSAMHNVLRNRQLRRRPQSSYVNYPLFKLWLVLICMQTTLNYNIPGLFVIAQDSICQDLAPSPTLEPFLDSLPIPPTIPVNLSQLVIGAYKITQVIHIVGCTPFNPI